MNAAPTFHVTANPTDSPAILSRRYYAVFGPEAFELCDEDADLAEASGMPRRWRLLDRTAALIRRADYVAGRRDEWGDPLPPRVYLCAAFARQADMRDVRTLLQGSGIAVVARWLDMPAAAPESIEDQGAIAQVCVEDIRSATALVAFTEDVGSAYFTGGRHVEVGIALASRIPVYVVGPVENVFHCHAQVTRCRDVDHVLDILQERYDR